MHEDNELLIIDKPAGLLTMCKRGENLPNAQGILTSYVRKGSSRSTRPVHLVHRLDRDTSGVLIFAKSRPAQDRLKKDWKNVHKKYLAIVHGSFPENNGVITSYLTENKDQFVHSTQTAADGKLSSTAYTVIQETNRYSLLEIDLLTGRKNQIRVHMAEAGHPVAGDVKYGKGEKNVKRMALHSKSISFSHPVTHKRLFFETDTPEIFNHLMRPRIK